MNQLTTVRTGEAISKPAEFLARTQSASAQAGHAGGAGKFTVVGHDEDTHHLFIMHVRANDSFQAFAAAAMKRPEAFFSVALPGHLTDDDGGITLPGESLVCTDTILEQTDVFGEAPDQAPENWPEEETVAREEPLQTPKLVVVIEGGSVSAVISDKALDVGVISYDYDKGDDLVQIPQAQGVFADGKAYTLSAEVDRARADELLDAIANPVPSPSEWPQL